MLIKGRQRAIHKSQQRIECSSNRSYTIGCRNALLLLVYL